jgi:pyrroline-5-carboxylate reductase
VTLPLPIAFLGGGNMATALLGGLLRANLAPASAVRVADPAPDRRADLAARFGVDATPDNAAAASGARLVVLAVKPQQAAEALASANLAPDLLLLSICAGLPTARLESLVPCRVVRAMPNLPALVGAGMTALSPGSRSTPADLDAAETLLSGAGQVARLPESQMDAVTGLSGSGPGYVFAFVEALEAAALELGFPPATARQMALQTVRGAAELAAATGEDPAELRRRVSSKGGTTLAGLAAMQAAGFPSAVRAAVFAARDRSAELGKA